MHVFTLSNCRTRDITKAELCEVDERHIHYDADASAIIPGDYSCFDVFVVNEHKFWDWRMLGLKLLLLLSPVLLFLPFLGKSLMYGTPSTDARSTAARHMCAPLMRWTRM